jgi:plastocyanin
MVFIWVVVRIKNHYYSFMRLLSRFSITFVLVLLLGLSAKSVLAASYTITIDETKFVPATLKVKVGDSITFINTTEATQSAKTTSSTGFNTGNIGPGGSKTVTLNTAGTFSYTSAFDTALQGTVTVEDALGTTASPTPTASAGATTKGGEIPVSGTTEVLMALMGGGIGLVAFGLLSDRMGTVSVKSNNPVVDVPPVSPYNDGDHE